MFYRLDITEGSVSITPYTRSKRGKQYGPKKTKSARTRAEQRVAVRELMESVPEQLSFTKLPV